MVRGHELKLIDVFFVQVRPSPWRQAVDLANICSSWRCSPMPSACTGMHVPFFTEFTEDEIADAFAAARGIVSPSQLRSDLKTDGRDLVRRFRSLGPAREPIAIQRWSMRRVLLTLSVLVGVVLAGGIIVTNWTAFT